MPGDSQAIFSTSMRPPLGFKRRWIDLWGRDYQEKRRGGVQRYSLDGPQLWYGSISAAVVNALDKNIRAVVLPVFYSARSETWQARFRSS